VCTAQVYKYLITDVTLFESTGVRMSVLVTQSPKHLQEYLPWLSYTHLNLQC
jgi:hypothetical protein